jgi:hypothetical protein
MAKIGIESVSVIYKGKKAKKNIPKQLPVAE